MTTVWLGAGVEQTLLKEATSKAPTETGGILLGWISGENICVTDVIGPGPGALHEPQSFEPDSGWQQKRIASLYKRSGRRLLYLGDWHTHPAGKPEPSEQDRLTLRAIAKTASARCPNPVMLILGQPNGSQWVASSHLYSSNPESPDSSRVEQVKTVLSSALHGWN